MKNFIFATGIECSYPLNKTSRGVIRRDILKESGHYDHWKKDFQLCKDLGVTHLRYGIPYYKMHTSPRLYDWTFSDEVLPFLRKTGITPIIDLCHFGTPDWAGGFQDDKWPQLFATFAEEFAKRYPWIQFYTPVNEMLISARFSGKLGLWNECLESDRAMVKALINVVKANSLAMEKILKNQPNAIFIQCEPAEVFHLRFESTKKETDFRNQFRFLTFDLLFGHQPGGNMVQFLRQNGMTSDDYENLLERGVKLAPYQIMGLDYYYVNERVIHPNGDETPLGSLVGWYALAKEYFNRYKRPMMLTETNSLGMDAKDGPEWLWKIWHSGMHLRNDNIPFIGMTWYSLIDQIDWSVLLSKKENKIDEVGLYTMDRKPRAVATAFKELIQKHKNEPLIANFPLVGIE